MEHTKVEITELEIAIKHVDTGALSELAELQLLSIGGGCAEVGFA